MGFSYKWFKDGDSRILNHFNECDWFKSGHTFSQYIIFQDIGLRIFKQTTHAIYYEITDEKKWFLYKIKHGL